MLSFKKRSGRDRSLVEKYSVTSVEMTKDCTVNYILDTILLLFAYYVLLQLHSYPIWQYQTCFQFTTYHNKQADSMLHKILPWKLLLYSKFEWLELVMMFKILNIYLWCQTFYFDNSSNMFTKHRHTPKDDILRRLLLDIN